LIDTQVGAYLSTGGAWTNSSDRELKAALRPVDTALVLEGVANLDITTWSYTSEGGGVRHMGPMAQDFHAQFGLGSDETSIATLDSDGVALASIQALYQKVQDLDTRVISQEERIAELEAQMEAQAAERSRPLPTGPLPMGLGVLALGVLSAAATARVGKGRER
jgi:hypothetical protein